LVGAAVDGEPVGDGVPVPVEVPDGEGLGDELGDGDVLGLGLAEPLGLGEGDLLCAGELDVQLGEGEGEPGTVGPIPAPTLERVGVPLGIGWPPPLLFPLGPTGWPLLACE
jgi:hypothetical protein